MVLRPWSLTQGQRRRRPIGLESMTGARRCARPVGVSEGIDEGKTPEVNKFIPEINKHIGYCAVQLGHEPCSPRDRPHRCKYEESLQVLFLHAHRCRWPPDGRHWTWVDPGGLAAMPRPASRCLGCFWSSLVPGLGCAALGVCCISGLLSVP